MNNVYKKIIKHSLYVFFALNIVMAFVIIKSYVYIIGWILGSCASIVGFTLSFLITDSFSLHAKTKKQGFWLGFSRTIITLIFHAIFLIAVLSMNSYVSGEHLFWSEIKAIINPINFYTYLFGIALIPIGTVVWVIKSQWKEDHEEIRRCNAKY